MAMHTQNLLGDPRASLLITPPESQRDPLGAARVTLMGSGHEGSEERSRIGARAVLVSSCKRGLLGRLR